MWHKAAPLTIEPEDRRTLEGWVRAHNTAQSLVIRSKIVLAAADGQSNNRISHAPKCLARQVLEECPEKLLRP